VLNNMRGDFRRQRKGESHRKKLVCPGHDGLRL
jgi:hypothetical protein